MRQLRNRTCCICTVDTSVQRPCLMMSTVDVMLGSFEVKGAATLASPSFTMGTSPSASSESMAACEARPPAPPPPYFARRAATRRFCSVCSLARDDFIAVQAAHWFPLASSFCSSSAYHVFCSSARSFLSLSDSMRILIARSLAFACNSIARALRSSGVICSGGFSPAFSVFTPAKPESSATPTCACLSAPTSFAPSPHMSV
mmetsp:Transcript_8587/g.34989  ORF Transcript_8587/g.34989 Transcript_8587/m.34989 type:complete len:202 (+) Transcript_8587:1076-1681(+)